MFLKLATLHTFVFEDHAYYQNTHGRTKNGLDQPSVDGAHKARVIVPVEHGPRQAKDQHYRPQCPVDVAAFLNDYNVELIKKF